MDDEAEWEIIKNDHFYFNASEHLRFVDYSTHDSRIYRYEDRQDAYKIMFDIYSREESSKLVDLYLGRDQASPIALMVSGVRAQGVVYVDGDDVAYPYQVKVFVPNTPDAWGVDIHGSAQTKAGRQELLRVVSTVRMFPWLGSIGTED